ncbi:glutamate ABC transporter substrate-binding protein [Actinomyces howellii]|uniref:Glutamine-binding periplasmic protein n=1 Tax=Actinomyces howellii TaxID=52771 RepID=A0A448HD31_9ACTO|nr:glutamate ABC transporter substrate-binding protein [Actinomyces howellii]VEG25513.1 Glutamine-binding periplasmic protein precursor [Actinomyces howellii]
MHVLPPGGPGASGPRGRSGPRRRRPVLACVLAALLALSGALAACSSAQDSGDHTIRIGIKFDQPGMGLKDGNRYTGFDADMGRALAAELGYSEDEIIWVQTVSAQRETMLANGQVDMILATYSITEARRQKITFAGPYFVAGQDLLVAEDSDITGPDDLDGRILCSVEGSTSAQTIREDYSETVQLFPVRTYAQCVEFLAAGTVDAVTTDDIILAGFAAQPLYSGTMRLVGQTFTEEQYGVGLPKDSPRCQDISAAITRLIEDGTWERLLAENVGASFTPNPELNPPTVDPGLCE